MIQSVGTANIEHNEDRFKDQFLPDLKTLKQKSNMKEK